MRRDHVAPGSAPVRPVVSRLFELMRAAPDLPGAEERVLEDLAARLSLFDEAPSGTPVPSTPVPSTPAPPEERQPGPD